MGWNFFKKKKSVLSMHKDIQKNMTEEEKKKLAEETKKIAEAFKVIQVIEDPTTGNISVNVIQNVRSQIEAIGIIYKGLKLMENEFNKAQQSRIVTR